MVAADYKMKRLAMNLEPSGIGGMPSFLAMMKGSSAAGQSMMPRWWLEPRYESVLVDAEHLAWQLRGGSVKAMTEDEFLNAAGDRERVAKPNPMTKKWADAMTAHYDELVAKDAIFGQLRNCMDLAVVAALIVKEGLADKAGYSMPLLLSASELPNNQYNAPRQVDSQASVMQKGRNWIISASGGVQIVPWSTIEQLKTDSSIADIRDKSEQAGQRWWWD
jgi:hypothetical protein